MAQDARRVDRKWDETARGQFQRCLRERQPENPILAGGTVNRSKVLADCRYIVEEFFQGSFTLRELMGPQPLADEANAPRTNVEVSQVSPGADTVSFKFAWPAGIDAIVETSKVRTKSLNGVEVVNRIDSKARLTTEPHGEGIAVRWHDSESVIETTPEDQGPGILVQKLIAQVLELSADVLVDTEGQVTDIDKTKKIQEQANKLFLDAAAVLQAYFKPDDLSMLQRMVADLSSPEQLQAAAFARWDLEVGQWHGMNFAAGASTRINTEITLAALGDFSIHATNDYMVKERVACNSDDKAKKCVHMVVHSALKPGQLDHINEKLGGRVTVTEVTNDHDLSLIIEPDTLLPHRIEENKISKLVFADEAKGSTVELESEKRVTHYRYLLR